MMSFLSELFTMFYHDMWHYANLNPRFQNHKIQNKRENKIKQSPLFMILTLTL